MLKDILSGEQAAQLRSLIDESQNIIVTCHTNADGDALGSCLGWAEYLRWLGKESTIIVPDQYPDYLMWMPNTEKVMRYDKRKEQADLVFGVADLVFCLDFNVTSRVADKNADGCGHSGRFRYVAGKGQRNRAYKLQRVRRTRCHSCRPREKADQPARGAVSRARCVY